MTDFTTKERKKVFDAIFKVKILPFFKNYGFERHTKTSKRIFKTFENDLSVFIFFEYGNRFGSYNVTVAYFDEELGNVYDDNYLAMANVKTGGFRGDNIETLNFEVDNWLNQLTDNLIPFLEKHNSHKAILESDQFYKSTARDKECRELLERKAKM